MAEANANKMHGVRFLPLLLGIALVCIVIAVGLLLFAGRNSGQDAQQIRHINEVVALSQKIPSLTMGALSGKAEALQVKGMTINSAAVAMIGNISGEKLPKSAASVAGRAKIDAATAPLKDSTTAPIRPMRRGRCGPLKAGNAPR